MRAISVVLGVVAVCVGLGWGLARGAESELTGSYWYAFDNITEVQDGAEILVWATVPPAWHGQQVEIGNIQPEPVGMIEDPATGNTVIEWRLEPEPFVLLPTLKPRHYFFHYDFKVSAQPLHWDGKSDGDYDIHQEAYLRYTRSETWLQTNGEVRDEARLIARGHEGPVAIARAFYDWIIGNLEFVPGGQGARDARSTLAGKAGDCEQFSLLFVAMCRSEGIPARTVTNLWPNETLHVFAEILLPDGRWLPVDLSVGQLMLPGGGGLAPDHAREFVQALGLPFGDPEYMFGNLYDDRVVMTVGNNITVASPTLGTDQVFQRLRPGGDAATPKALRTKGLNSDMVSGGFYVLGEQPASEDDAHRLVHLKLAERFFNAERFDVVDVGCRASLDMQPDAVKAWLNLGRVYMHKQEFYRAEAALKRALKGSIGNPAEHKEAKVWAHNYLGNCYDLLGHRDMALKEYGIVLEMDEDFNGAIRYAKRYIRKPYAKYPAKTGVR